MCWFILGLLRNTTSKYFTIRRIETRAYGCGISHLAGIYRQSLYALGENNLNSKIHVKVYSKSIVFFLLISLCTAITFVMRNCFISQKSRHFFSRHLSMRRLLSETVALRCRERLLRIRERLALMRPPVQVKLTGKAAPTLSYPLLGKNTRDDEVLVVTVNDHSGVVKAIVRALGT